MCAVLLAGCGATVAGVAVTESPDADGADVRLMDTGNYPTRAGHPIDNGGDDPFASAFKESQRMAGYVVDPSEADSALIHLEPRPTRVVPDKGNLFDVVGDPIREIEPGPLPDIAVAHGLVAGFSSARSSQAPDPPQTVINAVLRFPDNAAATAAATEMAANNPQLGISPAQPEPFASVPQAVASSYTSSDGSSVVTSFTAHGPYLLYQFVRVYREVHHAVILTENILQPQERSIDLFVPTDLAKLRDLPLDPSGHLGGRALPGPPNIAYINAGVYSGDGTLHFEENPIDGAKLFNNVGVDWVAQLRDEVFETRNAAGAAHFVDHYARTFAALPGVRPTTPVPGLPTAHCFERPAGWEPIAKAAEGGYKTQQWHYGCVARADRYAYVTYSDQETDIKQQVSAQYRMLAGK
jgi:hypothetical protein